MKEQLSALLKKLEGSRLAPLVQFVKFGMVGVMNTLISYVVEMTGYYLLFVSMTNEQCKVVIVSALSFLISVTNAYYWNNRFVFKGERVGLKQHLQAYVRTAACYALTGLILAPAMKVWLVNVGVAFWIASLSTLVLTIPLNFIMNKFWAFRK